MEITEHPPGGYTAPVTSKQAIWSLVLGILSIGCLWLLGSIPAIILGSVAIGKINREPDRIGGKGLAIAGIITGSVGVIAGLTSLAMFAAILTPALTSMNTNARVVDQSNDVRQLILTCHLYAADHDGLFPANLEELVAEEYLDNGDLLNTTDFETNSPAPFLYKSGLSDSGPRQPLILAPHWVGQKRVVGFTDGTVEVLWEREWDEAWEQ